MDSEIDLQNYTLKCLPRKMQLLRHRAPGKIVQKILVLCISISGQFITLNKE